MRYPKKLTVLQMSFLALAAVLNIAGANLALLIRIPLYLDTLGTFLAGSCWQAWGWAGVAGIGAMLTIISLTITLCTKK